MRFVRAVIVGAIVAAPAGCTLFTDFGGFSEKPPPAASEAGAVVDAAPSADVSTDETSETSAPVADAGPDASPYKLAVLADQPIAYWPFDEAPGANVAREIIGGKNAQLTGTMKFGVAGVDGTAIERTLADGTFDVGDNFDLPGKQAFSVELWAKPQSLDEYANVLYKRNAKLEGWVVYFVRNGVEITAAMEQRYPTGARYQKGLVFDPAGRLHHVVHVYDPTDTLDKRSRTYVDGVRTNGFNPDDNPSVDLTEPLQMATSFIGVLDEVAIYDHALTGERIAEHYKLASK